MFDAICNACVSLTEQYDDFWLLAALSDWSYEEGIRGGRNKGFGKAVDSYERAGVPATIIQQLRAGINGNLATVLRSQGIDVYRNPDRGHDLELRCSTSAFDHARIEVKMLYDCTLPKYYADVARDRGRLLSWKSPNIECVQAVFFTQLPCFNYPAGCWYGSAKPDKPRQTKHIGIESQFRYLMSAMPCQPTWPETGMHVHDLKFPTSSVTESLLQRRYEQIFAPAYTWKFNASEQFKNARVGVTLWRIE